MPAMYGCETYASAKSICLLICIWSKTVTLGMRKPYAISMANNRSPLQFLYDITLRSGKRTTAL